MNSCSPLTIFTGTKAMFIKLVPLALEFDRRKWHYRIIDTGQHADLVSHVIEQFGLREPEISLDPGQKGVSTLTGGFAWMLRLLSYMFNSRSALKAKLFEGKEGICFIHGDTVSTLLSCLIAKRAGQKVAHVEAGLRSHNYLHPFPEEIVRVMVMRMADILFAPSPSAMENLQKMGLDHKSHLLPGNTNIDTMRITLSRPQGEIPNVPKEYSLATIHRLETLYSQKKMRLMVDTLIEANSTVPLAFIMHPPTIKRLKKYNLQSRLTAAGIITLPLMDHSTFLHLLKNARFVITDGGSIQEEMSYLGVPCLLLRKTTEREEGIGRNVVLSGMDISKVRNFLHRFGDYRHVSLPNALLSPSACIADVISDLSALDG
ncbi:MAG: UDP-N-acetylglucosamine 2-epimerase [bacterium]|nr:UDP-N-acetylglucosamine 2-epimerase [bacterium]